LDENPGAERTMATKTQRKLKVKKLVKEQVLPDRRKYKTTYKDIKLWYNYINTVIFDGKLSPFNDVIIRDLTRQRCIGQVVIHEWNRKGTKQFHLEMQKFYKDKKEFVDTLAHECVHLYQMANLGDTGNHNAVFYSYRPKLKQIGLCL